jgi:hypothetical protein
MVNPATTADAASAEAIATLVRSEAERKYRNGRT